MLKIKGNTLKLVDNNDRKGFWILVQVFVPAFKIDFELRHASCNVYKKTGEWNYEFKRGISVDITIVFIRLFIRWCFYKPKW